MTFDAYKIYNKDTFEASGLVSKELTLILEGIGEKTVMLTRGNETSILFEGVFLPLGLTGVNPFVFDGYAIFLDPSNDIWLGVVNED